MTQQNAPAPKIFDDAFRAEMKEHGEFLAGSPCLNEPVRSLRVAALELALRQTRKDWRTNYGQFWQLRHENSRTIIGWRTDMMNKAWHAARREVRNYGLLREVLKSLRA